jgi:hypothetical protein
MRWVPSSGSRRRRELEELLRVLVVERGQAQQGERQEVLAVLPQAGELARQVPRLRLEELSRRVGQDSVGTSCQECRVARGLAGREDQDLVDTPDA